MRSIATLVAGGSGFAFLAGKAAPNDGVAAYGVYAGVMGQTTSSATSSPLSIASDVL